MGHFSIRVPPHASLPDHRCQALLTSIIRRLDMGFQNGPMPPSPAGRSAKLGRGRLSICRQGDAMRGVQCHALGGL